MTNKRKLFRDSVGSKASWFMLRLTWRDKSAQEGRIQKIEPGN